MKGVLVSLIVITFLLCAVAPAAGKLCGSQTCPNDDCCSQFGWCGNTYDYCSPEQKCQSYCWTGDGSGYNETVYEKKFNAKQINWNLTKANVNCAPQDANKSFEWRSKFNWTAFGGTGTGCGKCLRVENTKKNGKGETVHAIVRVVQTDIGNDFQMDSPVFSYLNFDQSPGHFYVNYHFIDCEDDENALHYTV